MGGSWALVRFALLLSAGISAAACGGQAGQPTTDAGTRPRETLEAVLPAMLTQLQTAEPGGTVGLISAEELTDKLQSDGTSERWWVHVYRVGGRQSVTYTFRQGTLYGPSSRLTLGGAYSVLAPDLGPYDGTGWLPVIGSAEVTRILNERGAAAYLERTGSQLRELWLNRQDDQRIVWEAFYSRLTPAGTPPNLAFRLQATVDATTGEVLMYEEWTGYGDAPSKRLTPIATPRPSG